MSSDYLEDIDDDENEMTVMLTMRASGHAWLSVIGEDSMAKYHLAPDETGWRNAEKIAWALKAWVEHTKQIAGVSE